MGFTVAALGAIVLMSASSHHTELDPSTVATQLEARRLQDNLTAMSLQDNLTAMNESGLLADPPARGARQQLVRFAGPVEGLGHTSKATCRGMGINAGVVSVAIAVDTSHAYAREYINPSAANRNHYAHSVHPAAVPGSMQAPSWYIPTHSGCTFKTFLEGVFGLDRCKHPRGT